MTNSERTRTTDNTTDTNTDTDTSTTTADKTPSQAKYGRLTNDSKSKANTQENTVTSCPECNGNIVKNADNKEYVCQDCGLVHDDDNIDHGPEWRAYNAKERDKKSRTGSPLTELRHDRGLTTDIDWKNKDAHGREISADKRKQMRRLRKWDYRAKRDSKDNNISYANGEIRRMGAALGVPKNVMETAASIYREAHNADLLPGRSTEAMATGALYIALRIHNKPRSVDELTSVSRVKRKRIQRSYRYMCSELSIGLKPSQPTEYLPRFATKLNVPKPIERTASRLLEDVQGTHHVSGNDPTVLAASALYAASILHGNLITQVDIKTECNVTEVSIRTNYELFLVHSENSPITQNDIDGVKGPINLAKKLHGDIMYLNKSGADDTAHDLPVVHDDDNGVLTFSDIDSKLYDCESCDEHFTNLEDLSRHRSRVHDTDALASQYPSNEYNFECPFCPRITDTYIGLNTHIGHVHSDNADNTTTTLRHSASSKSDSYNRKGCAVNATTHPVRTTDGEPENGFVCEYCTESFDAYMLLRAHQNAAHNGALNDNDDVLSDEYTSSSQNTVTTTGSDSPLNYICPRCDNVYNTHHGLRIHIGRMHKSVTTPDKHACVVPPTTHPVDTTPQNDGSNTIGDTNTVAIGYSESYALSEEVNTVFDTYEVSFHPAVKQLTHVFIATAGKNIGTDATRTMSSAVASALYASLQIVGPVTDSSYTQEELADITDVSQTLISQTYPCYLQVFNEFTDEFDAVCDSRNICN